MKTIEVSDEFLSMLEEWEKAWPEYFKGLTHEQGLGLMMLSFAARRDQALGLRFLTHFMTMIVPKAASR